MAVPVNPLTDNFSVAPQLSAGDMSAVAAAGYKSVIINRPDFEGGEQQPTSEDVIVAAQSAGLQVAYQPVVSGAITSEDVSHFAELFKTMPKPVLAYCRSGTRCTQLFQAASSS